jgi:hypothetical protein
VKGGAHMPKFKEYYPLYVCKQAKALEKDYIFNMDEMTILSKGIYPMPAKNAAVEACAKRVWTQKQAIIRFKKYDDISDEGIQIADFASSIHTWSKNKQVFKFDGDFLNEFLDTESFHIAKDMFDYLPCKTMYLDFSDSQHIKDAYGILGVFADVIKDDIQDSWEIHLFIMKGDMEYDRIILPLKNLEDDFTWEHELIRLKLAMNFIMHGEKKAEEAKQKLKLYILVLQMLCYLSSIEPDVRESEITKHTYKPRTSGAPVKNKFSEVQQHDVGVRYGTAFRKYSVHRESNGAAKHGTSSSKRPHYRKEHWSWYWYNKLDENGETVYNVYGVPEKVKRPKWIHGVMVNEKYGESDMVIHNVAKE